MPDETATLVLEHLRRIERKVDHLQTVITEVKGRMTNVEKHQASLHAEIALLHGDFAAQSLRLDRLERRAGRIEKQLSLTDN